MKPTRLLVARLLALVLGLAMPVVTAPSQAAVDRTEDPALGAPGAVVATPVVSGLRVTWSAPTDADTLTGYRVTTPQGFDRTTAVDERSVLVDLESPGEPVAVSVVAIHGDDTSPPATASGAALAPGGLQRVLASPGRLADATVTAGRALSARLTGRAGVPSGGVRSVLVLVQVRNATRTTTIRLGDGATRTSITVAKGESRVRTVSLPIGSGASGNAARVTATVGSARVRIDALGWSTTAASTASSAVGRLFVGAPAVALTTTSLAGSARRKVVVRGVGQVPPTGVRAVLVTLRATAGSAAASLAVGPSGGSLAVPALMTPARTSDSVTLPVALGADGRIELRNLGSRPTSVTAQVVGWTGDGTVPETGLWTTETAPVAVLSSRVAGSRTSTVAVAGRGGVPGVLSASPPRAVLVRATVTGTSTTGTSTLSLGPSSAALGLPVAIAIATRPSTTLTWVDLSDTGTITARNGTSRPVDVRLDVLAWSVDRPTLTSDAVVLTSAEAARYGALEGGSVSVTGPSVAPTVGKVLVSGPSPTNPQGFLARVLSVTRDGGTYDLGTEPADLSDVVRDASGSASVGLDTPTATDQADDGVTAGRPTGPATDRRGMGVTLERLFDRGATSPLPGGGEATLRLQGSATLSAEANIDIDVGWRGVRAELSATAAEGLTGSMTASAGFSNGVHVDLGSFSFRTFVVQIGPVPVVVTPVASLALDAGLYVDSSITATFDQSSSGTVGLRFDDGVDVIKEFEHEDPSLELTATPPQIGGHAELSVELGLQFYKAATVGIGLTAGVSTQYATNSCFVENTGYLDARISAGIELPVVDDISYSTSTRLKEWDLPDIRVPGDPGCPWTGVVEITSSWQGRGDVEGGHFSRSGNTTLNLRRVSPEDSRLGYWVGTGTNAFSAYSAYAPDCFYTGSGRVDLPTEVRPEPEPEPDVYGVSYDEASAQWSFHVNGLAGTTHSDSGICGGATDSDVFLTTNDIGVDLALRRVEQELTTAGNRAEGTFTFPVDAACGPLAVPSGQHWCQGVSGAESYSGSGQIQVRVRLTTLEDLDADGIPDPDQNP